MIALVAAVAQNRVIGKDGSLPWNLPQDITYFKTLTIGNIVIMGRRTFESTGALAKRTCIILSKTRAFSGEHIYTAQSVSDALALAKSLAVPQTQNANGIASPRRDIFFCGGARVYEEALPFCEKLFITEIHADFEGDVFFPEFDKSRFAKKILAHTTTEKVFYDFVLYEKR